MEEKEKLSKISANPLQDLKDFCWQQHLDWGYASIKEIKDYDQGFCVGADQAFLKIIGYIDHLLEDSRYLQKEKNREKAQEIMNVLSEAMNIKGKIV